MPAAGHRQGKYVKKVHYLNTFTKKTACGKYINNPEMTTIEPLDVTCKTCRRAVRAWARVPEDY